MESDDLAGLGLASALAALELSARSYQEPYWRKAEVFATSVNAAVGTHIGLPGAVQGCADRTEADGALAGLRLLNDRGLYA